MFNILENINFGFILVDLRFFKDVDYHLNEVDSKFFKNTNNCILEILVIKYFNIYIFVNNFFGC